MDDVADFVPSFRYTSLDRSTRSIRLLRFDPAGRKRYHMHFILETFELAKCPPFAALSYTWGSPQSTQIVAVNQQQLPTRENLYRALEVLATDKASWVPARSVSEVEDTKTGYELIGNYYWIDYICINQDDPFERGHQVGLMESIFSAASCVISWLGVATEDSDRAVRALRRKVDLDKDTSWEDGSVENLLDRPFWGRIWIVQEFILPKKLLILCGRAGVWWESIRDNPSVFRNQVQRPIGKPVKIKHHDAFYLFQWRGIQQDPSSVGIVALPTSSDRASLTQPSLDALIRHFYRWECGDPRDRIYGLLSLATKDSWVVADRSPLEADYNIPPQKLYHRVLAYMRNLPSLSGMSAWNDFRVILSKALRVESDREFLRNGFIYDFPAMRAGTENIVEVAQNILKREGDEKSFDPLFFTMTPQAVYDDILEYFEAFPREEDPMAWRDFENAMVSIMPGRGKRIRMIAKSKLMYLFIIVRSFRQQFQWSEEERDLDYMATELGRSIDRMRDRLSPRVLWWKARRHANLLKYRDYAAPRWMRSQGYRVAEDLVEPCDYLATKWKGLIEEIKRNTAERTKEGPQWTRWRRGKSVAQVPLGTMYTYEYKGRLFHTRNPPLQDRKVSFDAPYDYRMAHTYLPT